MIFQQKTLLRRPDLRHTGGVSIKIYADGRNKMWVPIYNR